MRVFSKIEWHKSADKQLQEGTLSQLEIEDAERIWVDKFNGRTEEELKDEQLNPAWFVEV